MPDDLPDFYICFNFDNPILVLTSSKAYVFENLAGIGSAFGLFIAFNKVIMLLLKVKFHNNVGKRAKKL